MVEVPAQRMPRPPFLTVGRLTTALLLYALIALVPPAPFERPLFLLKLASSPAPERVAVPVDGVRAADLRGGWGNPRSGGRRHEGIDIFAARGTRVVASVEGIVWRTGTDTLGGLVVWVLGPGRQMHYYAHLERRADVRPGDRVNVGDTLGFVGTSGNARGGPPHLHYGIYAGAAGAIDPYPLLADRDRLFTPDAASRRSAAPPPTPVDRAPRPAAPSARSRTEPPPAS